MKVVDLNDTRYPKMLKQITAPPDKLYYKGLWDTGIFSHCLAVVGSRKMTQYGKSITNKLVEEIAFSGVTIVSGFMYGVDAQAHTAAISGGGRTIAVMPCGIDLIHPAYQKRLYKEILDKKGLIVSETKGKVSPSAWSFPKRNRIVAGLCMATLVIEAGLKSGSLITAYLTRKFGRKLFAVPGPVNSPVSKGTLQLIKEGACMVTCAGDVLSYYGLSPKNFSRDKAVCTGLSTTEENILGHLQQEPLGIDVLARLVKIDVSTLGGVLSLLQIKGIVQKEGLRYYACNL